MKSVMTHRFSEVPRVDIPRSTFERSHGYKTTFDAGYLVPFFLDEALPGDTFDLKMTGFARLSTPIFPIMDNMKMETFFFAVPFRLVWDNWQKFCGEQVDPGDSIDYTIPYVNINNAGNETIFDYMGIPTKIAANNPVSCLPLRAYNLIYNEWFRDQNLQDSVDVDKDNGPDSQAQFELLRRGKRHDYFTSCLPWLQKGDAVLLPLGTSADVAGTSSVTITGNAPFRRIGPYGSGSSGSGDTDFAGTAISNEYYGQLAWDNVNKPYIYGGDFAGAGVVTGTADLTTAIGPTVNELRQVIQVQRIMERDARSGTRYTEILQSHFGVTSPDARLQRPEYLGGGSSFVNISPIPRTDSSPGELGAMGVSLLNGHGFVKSFTEHCFIIGIVNVRADLTYQEGLDRLWSRESRFDFYWPALAHLGEQAVLNKEIYIDAATIGDTSCDDVFGYQERFAEYRYKKSMITGKFRSNDAASLDAWHLGIEFGTTPTLDDTFIVDNPPVDRVIATPSEPHFIFDSYINLRCTRPMPTYSIPGLIDHF